MKATYITFLFIIIIIACFSFIEPLANPKEPKESNQSIPQTDHKKILMQIVNLQTMEQSLYNNLNNDPKKASNAVSNINKIAMYRNELFDKLINDANTAIKSSPKMEKDNRLFGEINNELGKRKRQLSTGNKFENMKMAEINNYYNERSKAYVSFFKFLFYCSIPLLIISVLINRNILPSMYGKILIGIVLFVILFWGGTQYYDIISRNNMNFDEYDFGREFNTEDTSGGPTDSPYPTGCIDSNCCAPGTIYDNSKGLCVIPSS
jgi:hypothetical protein